jgi:hypothetical protein
MLGSGVADAARRCTGVITRRFNAELNSNAADAAIPAFGLDELL